MKVSSPRSWPNRGLRHRVCESRRRCRPLLRQPETAITTLIRRTLWILGAAIALAACGDDDPNLPSTKIQPAATQVTLPVAITQPAAGWAFSCGVAADGSLRCWGANSYGQLGNAGAGVSCVEGYARCSDGPVQVLPTTRQWRVARGAIRHACGIDNANAAWCWGRNSSGQLGDGSSTSSNVPVAVAGGLTFASLALSLTADLSCGVTSGNALYCWGAGYAGQGGTGGVTVVSTVPYRVAPTQSFTAAALGDYHACALDVAGAAWCWGDNSYGQVGDTTNAQRTAPVAVAGGRSYTQLVTGLIHSCALDAAGVAYCWGAADFIGRATGNATERATPAAVTGAPAFTRIAAGAYHTCGLTAAGATWCWGDNGTAQFGDQSTTPSLLPKAIPNLPAFAQLVAGGGHTCGVTAAGVMFCWGANSYGQGGRLQ